MKWWSDDRRVALAQRRTMMASLVCVIWLVIAAGGCLVGQVSVPGFVAEACFCAVGIVGFNLVIRSGRTVHLKDLGMSQAQMVYAMLCMCGFYMLMPQIRAAVVQAMCLALIFSTFSLSAQECRRVGVVLAALPLATVGVLALMRGDAFSWSDDALPAVGGSAVILVMSRLLSHFCRLRESLHRQRNELKSLVSQTEHLAMTDELTGLFNRRRMLDELELAMGRHQRSQTPLCLALVDVDRFKQVNDQHGHHIGDEVLQGVAHVLKDRLRVTDILARWGGEEFLVLLPDARADDAKMVLDRVLDVLMAHEVSASKPALRVSFSAGVACWDGRESLEAVVARADHAMYGAKAQGRSQVVVGLESVIVRSDHRTSAAACQLAS